MLDALLAIVGFISSGALLAAANASFQREMANTWPILIVATFVTTVASLVFLTRALFG